MGKLSRVLMGLVMSLCLISLFTGCATIIHGTRQPIQIVSNPSRANVWVDHVYAGFTPLIANLSRRDNHLIRIELEGYHPYQTMITRQISGWVLGNVFIGGFLGIAIDAISGGIYQLTPEQVNSELQSESIVRNESGAPHIFVVMKPSPSWRKIGSLSHR